jgi:60 kDa SS-A/Ro ribonucleoprotein
MLSSLLSLITRGGQRAPMAGARTPQVENSAGGHTWAADIWSRLDRFLVLGSDGGTYYARPQAKALEELAAVEAALAADGVQAVARICAISAGGRAPRNDAAILALAVALKRGDAATRKAAAAAVPRICRTGTHLFQLATAVDQLGGWGRTTRRAFAGWYAADPTRLALQGVKYAQRDGWSHRDLLRKTHARPPSSEHDALYGWMCRGFPDGLPKRTPDGALALPWAAAKAQRVGRAGEVVALIESHGLPREAVPTRWLAKPSVWRALLLSGRGMPMTAMLRNLATMTRVGVFDADEAALDAVTSGLADAERLRRARVHPLSILVALNTYRSGKGRRGSSTWTPHARILDALDQAFDLSFQAVEPTGKRHLLAIDVSGSMGWSEIAGMTGVTPRVGAAAMAMAALRTERRSQVLAFSHRLVPVDLSARMRLDRVMDTMARVPMGGTDCALPMLHAIERKLAVDVFVVYTDSETWHGEVHPAEALRRYRQAMGIDAKLIVVGMVSNGFTIADPDDPGMLDVVGFDTAAPALMAEFARG